MKKVQFLSIFYFLIFAFIIVSQNLLWAQKSDIKFNHLSIEQGLSQSSVTSIIQDSQGFMWFGTLDGLNRYDGYQITTFMKEVNNPESITDNNITALFEDKYGLIWIGTHNTGICIYNRVTNKFLNIKHLSNTDSSLTSDYIKCFYADENNNIWIGTANGINKLKLPPSRKEFIEKLRSGKNLEIKTYLTSPYRKQNSVNNQVNQIISSPNQGFLIATNNGIKVRDDKTENFIDCCIINKTSNRNIVIPRKINAIFIDKSQILWIGTDNGLFKSRISDKNSKEIIIEDVFIKKQEMPFAISDNVITSIITDNAATTVSEGLWIGTRKGGLNRMIRETSESFKFIHYKYDPFNQQSLSVDHVLTLFQSKENVLWIGTSLGGVNKWDKATENIELYRHNPYDNNTISSKQVRTFHEDKNGDIWIGTVDGGLNFWDRDNYCFIHYKHDPANPRSISDNHVRSIFEDSRGNFWIGTGNGGLNLFNRRTGTFKHFTNDPEKQESIGDNNIWCIFEDSRNFLWIGTTNGLSRYDYDSNTFEVFKNVPNNVNSLNNNHITAIEEDKVGKLWLGTFGGGLNSMKYIGEENGKTTWKFEHLTHLENDPHSIKSNVIYSLYEDPEGTLWIGTKGGGLNKFDRQYRIFSNFTTEDGLPNNVVMGIIEDKAGNLWISTNTGICKFSKNNETVKNYTIKDGLQSNEFLVGSYCKTKHEQLLFGGINGFNAFYPERLKENSYIPKIIITDFQVYNQPIDSDSSISVKKQINLSYKDKMIYFEFVALNYIYPEKNLYAYKMEGVDQDWHYIGKRRNVTYTNMRPGKYFFRVKGSNSDEIWNETGTSISVIISPPFWMTTWFYILIFIILVTIIISIIKWRERKHLHDKKVLENAVEERTQEINQQKEEIQTQAEQLEEANKELANANIEIKQGAKMKEMFLATTSHEIRTPLNIIIGFTNLLLNLNPNKKQLSYLNRIMSSSNNLLVLINDILDFSKIEAGKLSIECIEFEFRELISNVVSSILVKANEKHIKFRHNINRKIPKYVYGDPVRLSQILINLAGNAIKFTSEQGKVNISIELKEVTKTEATLNFKITDTGIGMSDEQMDKIFESFTQASSDTTRKFGGTGLGLSIVKKLVELQNGHIYVDSTMNKGSVFTFFLRYKIGDGTHVRKKANSFIISKAENRKALRLLLVDDNPVNRALAIDTIKMYNDRIKIDEAENGIQALDKVEKNNYHLIIMDLQMPEMDGFEATIQIRERIESDLEKMPILAMSAHALREEQDRCFNIGMNDYLTKPFVPEDLFSKIENLTNHITVEETSEANNNNVEQATVIIETKTAAKEISQYKNIDLSLLYDTYENDTSKVKKILELCMKNIPVQIQQLINNYDNNDWKQVRILAHSLKTTLNYIGLKELNQIAKIIEYNAAEEKDMDKVPNMIARIETVWKEAFNEINDYIISQ